MRSSHAHGVPALPLVCGLLAVSALNAWIGTALTVGLSIITISLAVSASGFADSEGRSVVGSLPLGAVALVGSLTSIGILLGAMGGSSWTSRTAAWAVFGGGAAALLAIAWRRGTRVELIGRDWPAAVCGVVLLIFGAVVVVVRPFEVWSRVFSLGTDFMRHAIMVRSLQTRGAHDLMNGAYPRGLHAVVAWITQMGPDPTALGPRTWVALASTFWVLLCLLVVAACRLCTALSESLGIPRLLGQVAAILTSSVVIQTAWFDVFLSQGGLGNVLAAVCLLSAVAAPLPNGPPPRQWWGSRTSAVAAAVVLVAVGNSWQFVLPAAAAWCLVVFASWIRGPSRDALGWSAWAGAAVLAVVSTQPYLRSLGGFLGIGAFDQPSPPPGQREALGTNALGWVRTPAVSGLFAPEWWWTVVVLAGFAVALLGVRRGMPWWSLSTVLLGLAGAVTVGGLIWISGSTWDHLYYYPAKLLWTLLVVWIPIGVLGLSMASIWVWDLAGGLRPHVLAVLTRTSLICALAVCCIASLGRAAAFGPHLWRIYLGRSGAIPFPLAMMADLEARTRVPQPSQPVLVVGLLPEATSNEILNGARGYYDMLAIEALQMYQGVVVDRELEVALLGSDEPGVCRWLAANPDAVRITGPNPRTGPKWLLAAGCPRSTVRPGQWIHTDLESSWLAGSPMAEGSYNYPTYEQYQQYVRRVRPGAADQRYDPPSPEPTPATRG